MLAINRILLGFFIYFLCQIAHAADSWEYQVTHYLLTGDFPKLNKQLNALGAKGWELVTCTEADATLTCIFKRKKS